MMLVLSPNVVCCGILHIRAQIARYISSKPTVYKPLDLPRLTCLLFPIVWKYVSTIHLSSSRAPSELACFVLSWLSQRYTMWWFSQYRKRPVLVCKPWASKSKVNYFSDPYTNRILALPTLWPSAVFSGFSSDAGRHKRKTRRNTENECFHHLLALFFLNDTLIGV